MALLLPYCFFFLFSLVNCTKYSGKSCKDCVEVSGVSLRSFIMTLGVWKCSQIWPKAPGLVISSNSLLRYSLPNFPKNKWKTKKQAHTLVFCRKEALGKVLISYKYF